MQWINKRLGLAIFIKADGKINLENQLLNTTKGRIKNLNSSVLNIVRLGS